MAKPGMGHAPEPEDGRVRSASSSTSSYSAADGRLPLHDQTLLCPRAGDEERQGPARGGKGDRARCMPFPPFLGTYCLLILMLLVSAVSCLVGYLIGSGSQPSPDAAGGAPSPQRMTAGSPLSHDLGGLNASTELFNGSFFHLDVFRQPPGPVVDAAWGGLGTDYRPVVVPDAQGPAVGLVGGRVRVSDKYGGGYIANVEGLHHLHCLNLLRKGLYFNYDYYRKDGSGRTNGTGPFANEDYILRAHITHCLDTLRQRLMCVVDVGMLGQIWWNKKHPQPFPDFGNNHTCWGGYEAVRKWAEEHQVPADPPADYLLPPRDEDVLEQIP